MTKCPNCGHDFQAHIEDASTPLDYDIIHRNKISYQARYRKAKYGWIDSIFWLILYFFTEYMLYTLLFSNPLQGPVPHVLGTSLFL